MKNGMKTTPLSLYRRRISKEIDRHRTEMERLQKLLKIKQQVCKHKMQFVMGTGNNDSYHECSMCGLQQ